MRVDWTPLADRDLERILLHIAEDNAPAAWRVFDRIKALAARLEQFPNMGSPSHIPGTRTLFVAGAPYLIHYAVLPDRVVILRVLHGARSGAKRYSENCSLDSRA